MDINMKLMILVLSSVGFSSETGMIHKYLRLEEVEKGTSIYSYHPDLSSVVKNLYGVLHHTWEVEGNGIEHQSRLCTSYDCIPRYVEWLHFIDVMKLAS